MSHSDQDFYVWHSFKLRKTSKLTEEVVELIDHLLDSTSPQEYRDTLIEIYHIYLYKESPDFPMNFPQMAGQMYFLIDFFRRADEEMKGEEGISTTLPEKPL
jgi:hypothetical protein